MKKTLALLLALVMLVALMAGCASEDTSADTGKDSGKKEEAAETYEFTLAHHLSDDSFCGAAFLYFADLVEEETEGRITINVASGASLGSQREVVEAVNLGTIAMAMGECGYYSNYDPSFGVMNLPFLYETGEDFLAAMDGEPGQALEAKLEEVTNMKLVSWLYCGGRDVYSVKEMKDMSSLNGLKVRTPESAIYVETFKALGANPTAIAATEMYTSMQQGVVDAMEGTGETAYNYKIYEVGSYCLLTGHIQNDTSLVMNKDIYDSLPDDLRAILDECFVALEEYERNYQSEKAAGYTDLLVDNGMQYAEIDIDAARESVKPFYESYVGDDAFMQELFDMLTA